MTSTNENSSAGEVVGQEAGPDTYPPTVTCPSDNCYQSITDPAKSRFIDFDGKGNAYVSTFDGNLFELDLAVGRRENDPLDPPKLIASGFHDNYLDNAYGMTLDRRGNAYVVNGGGKLWRVPLDQQPPDEVASGLYSERGGSVDVAVDCEGEYAYVITRGGDLWRVPLHDGASKEPVAINLGITYGTVLDGDGRNIYVVNDAGVLWRVPLPALNSNQLAVPEQVGSTIPGGGWGVTLDWVGKNAYVVGSGGLWRVPLDGGAPKQAATGLGRLSTVALDERGNAFVVRDPASGMWRIDGVALAAPVPSLSTPAPGARTGQTVKFSGYAPGATRILVQDLNGIVVGSQTVRADTGYWAWALGENLLNVDLAGGRFGPVSRRGLPWDPGPHTLQFVACNNIGVTAPTAITFIVR